MLTRKALREGRRALTMIVDNETAQKNVTRMAEKTGMPVQAEHKDDGIYLHISGQGRPGHGAASDGGRQGDRRRKDRWCCLCPASSWAGANTPNWARS